MVGDVKGQIPSALRAKIRGTGFFSEWDGSFQRAFSRGVTRAYCCLPGWPWGQSREVANVIIQGRDDGGDKGW